MVGEEAEGDAHADIADRITGEIRRHDAPDVADEK
jgi:hypothetical protein